MITCRICHSDKLELFLDLGKQPLADNFLTKAQLKEEEPVYPLQVYFCHDCTLVQLGYVVPPEILYHADYPYETGVNDGGVKHFRRLAQEVVSKFNLQPNDLVIDIGSNDGTALIEFKKLKCKVLGVEPVNEIAKKAKVPTIVSLFSRRLLDNWPSAKGAKVVTATNVVAHIDDLHEFVSCVKDLLLDDGVFVMEAPFLADMLNSVDFGQIYHEHLSYFSTAPLQKLFDMHDMVIINAEWQDVHGGSMRYYVGKKPQKSWLLSMGDTITLPMLNLFAENVKDFKRDFRRTLHDLRSLDYSICGVSAPAKGNTLLNYCKINKTFHYIDYITERSKKKIGKYTPGTHIEIVPDSRLIKDQPDYAILFAHNWGRQIMKSLKGYEGKWIVANEEGFKGFSAWESRSRRKRNQERATA